MNDSSIDLQSTLEDKVYLPDDASLSGPNGVGSAVANDYLNNGKGRYSSESQLNALSERVFSGPDQVVENYDPNNVSDRSALASKLLNPDYASQGRNGPMAVQAATVFEAIRKMSGGNKENFLPAEGLTDAERKRFNEVRDWIFNDGTSAMDKGNATAAALCRVYNNYAEAALTGKIPSTESFGEYLIHDIRIGGIAMGHDNPAPVYDEGKMPGFTDTIMIGDSAARSNNFGNFHIGSDGTPENIAPPLTNSKLHSTLDPLPAGSVVQVYGDTNPKTDLGPNHYYLIMKNADGTWINLNNNPGDANDFARAVNINNKRIYGLFYDQ